MTVLENLYNVNINPSELQHLTAREDYINALSRVCEACEKLEKTLTEVHDSFKSTL